MTIIFLIWSLSVLVVSYFGFSTLPNSGSVSTLFWERFSNWDGGHYLEIAQHGYRQTFQYAFFPLYPLAIRLINYITGNYLIAAILISVLSSFLSLQILHKLISLDFDKKIAEKSILALIFFPASFYFLTVYSEGLFFLLTVSTFYFMKQKRFFWAALLASLASATRLVGLAVVLALLVEVVRHQGLNRKNFYILLISFLGFLSYGIFLYKQVGDPFYFIVAELHWQRSLSIPGFSFWETINNLTSQGFIHSNLISILDLLFAIFGLGLAIRSFRFLPISYATYALASVSLPLFTPTLSSMPRFLLTIFPLFILIALIKNKFVFLAYQIIFLMGLSIFTVLFINGYWIA